MYSLNAAKLRRSWSSTRDDVETIIGVEKESTWIQVQTGQVRQLFIDWRWLG
jgi:hypothetical protein